MTKHMPPNPQDGGFRSEILTGLKQSQKIIGSKWLYDDVGSHLFEAITELDAYYPTRTELSILEQHARDYAHLSGARGALVELGSGSSRKTSLLLDAFKDLSVYMPIDISSNHLKEAAERMRRAYPSLAVIPVAADFTLPFGKLPLLPELPVLVFFPGSTIGNFQRPEAVKLLENIRSAIPEAIMIVGVDRPKEEEVLIEAYDDPAGVTAAFNRNVLQRINRELDADFSLADFRHRAIWNASESRIEMHLESLRQQTVTICGNVFNFRDGETIHTENSHKFSKENFAEIANQGGWKIRDQVSDAKDWFSIYTLETL